MKIAFWTSLVALGILWGWSERLQERLRQGFSFGQLGLQRSHLVVTVVQGGASLLLFSLFIAGFWMFGWKVGLLAVFAGFTIAAVSGG